MDLYRLVYTSTNLLEGTEAQQTAAFADILASSRQNNAKVAVTGALLFNGGCFAQVLEGPRRAVETTFERIQRDARHSEVSVLQCEAVEARGFPNWSMAFIGHSARGRALWNEIASRTGFDLARMEGDHLFTTLRAIVEAEEGPVTTVTPASTAAVDWRGAASRPAGGLGGALDTDLLRSELRDRLPGRDLPAEGAIPTASTLARPARSGSAGPATAPTPDAAVLRAALAEERQRTTNLRLSLDDARIALAVAVDESAMLRRERDQWADRARALASALCQDLAVPSRGPFLDPTEPGSSPLRAVG